MGYSLAKGIWSKLQKKGPIGMHSVKPLILSDFRAVNPCVPGPGQAGAGPDPAYIHGISDLRSARAFLQQDTRPQFAGLRSHAIDEITHAIQDMKKAAVDDGKSLNYNPPPQSGGTMEAPVHAALRLLHEARNDISRGTDSPMNLGLQARSLKHIDEAIRALQQIVGGGR